MKHISVKYRYLHDAITNQEVWLRKVGTNHIVADGLTKVVNQQVKELVDHTENRAVGNFTQTCVHQFDRGQKYTERADG